MEIIKLYSRKSLFWIIALISLLCIFIASGFHFAMALTSEKILMMFVAQANAKIPETKTFIDQIAMTTDILKVWFVPLSTGILFLFGLCLWGILYRSFGKLIKATDTVTKKKEVKPVTKTAVDEKKEKMQNDSRMFLFMLSVLQREGRFMDFLSEDLDEYEDDQIGAAVRNIHESCKKTVNKYLTSKSVIDEEEGEKIVIPAGFDPNTIKLTGNVTGAPPFKGVVRHRGWKAARLDMPTLSGSRDPHIIAPAEVEI